MILIILFNVLVDIVSIIFYAFDPITTLPIIGGVDIDSMLVTAVGWMNRIFVAFWPVEIMFHAFLFIMSYYATKLILKFFLGHRVPSNT